MFKVLFGEVTKGRLMRLQYLGYSLLLVFLMIAFVAAVILAIGAGEHLIGGDLKLAQNKLREWFTLPFIVIFGLVSASLVFGGVNMMAKRIRDIGLPGWWMVLAITVLECILSYAVSKQAGSGLYPLILVVLMLIPTNAIKGGQA